MTINKWNPNREITKQEQAILRRLRRHKKLFAFLREQRHELFDDKFQDELAAMYRDTGAGKEPITPALMAMATLLQDYSGVSDAEVVERTVMERRWQLVLGCLGAEEPAFSQGAFWDFRERFIAHDMDRRFLERTREVAKKCGGFDYRKLPKKLRVAADSSPLEGAGRVEDTINLLGHGARKLVSIVAALLGMTFAEVATAAGSPLLLESSIKAGLDLRWDKPGAVDAGLGTLLEQLDSLQAWIVEHLPEPGEHPRLQESLATLDGIREQDITVESGVPQIRQGTAKERRISIEDGEMRHGRKSRSRTINGYKRHIALDLDTNLILACAVTPANQQEHHAARELADDIELQELEIDKLYIDRGYLASEVVAEVDRDGSVICRPWKVSNDNGLYSKEDFNINVRDKLITCPTGQQKPFEFGRTVRFDAKVCDECPARSQCTAAKPGRGRSVHIAKNEKLHKRLRKRAATSQGRKELRERVPVEHALAHISQRQGNRARYYGARKNLFALRRSATVHNLEAIQRSAQRTAKAA